jgi:VCBS repeat-containing protein
MTMKDGTSNIATITVNGVNDAPVNNDSTSTNVKITCKV